MIKGIDSLFAEWIA